MKKLKIFIGEIHDFNPDVLKKIKNNFDITNFPKNVAIKEILNEVDVFWFRLGYKIDNSVLDEHSRCKFLVTPVTGIDHIDEDLCIKLGIKVISLKGEYEFLKSIRATAELTIAMTLALLRNLPDAVIHTREGLWDRDKFRGQELFQKNVGIIGMGRLGAIVASYFKAFGCNVSFYDNTEKASFDFKQHGTLDALLQESDIVSLHVNYNKGNHHFFGKEQFYKMKRNSILINTSRGGLVDENALLDSLIEGEISGAALDVLQGEPEVSSNKLIVYASKHHNLIITPHIGGNTYESFEKTESFIFDKLLRTIYKSCD